MIAYESTRMTHGKYPARFWNSGSFVREQSRFNIGLFANFWRTWHWFNCRLELKDKKLIELGSGTCSVWSPNRKGLWIPEEGIDTEKPDVPLSRTYS